MGLFNMCLNMQKGRARGPPLFKNKIYFAKMMTSVNRASDSMNARPISMAN